MRHTVNVAGATRPSIIPISYRRYLFKRMQRRAFLEKFYRRHACNIHTRIFSDLRSECFHYNGSNVVISKGPCRSNNTDTLIVTFSFLLISIRNMKYLSRGFHSFEKFSFRGKVFQLSATFHVTKDNDCALFFFRGSTRALKSFVSLW